jgi:hypothetical protein
MVAIADKMNGGGGGTVKHEQNHQTVRIIQWLGGERAGIDYLLNKELLKLYFS